MWALPLQVPGAVEPRWPLSWEPPQGQQRGQAVGGPAGAGMWSRLPEGLVFQEKWQVWIWGWQPLISQSWQSRPHTQPALWGAFLQVPTEPPSPPVTTQEPPRLSLTPPGGSLTLSLPKTVGRGPGGPESNGNPKKCCSKGQLTYSIVTPGEAVPLEPSSDPPQARLGQEGVLHPQLHSFQGRGAPPNRQAGHPDTGAALLNRP